MSIVDFSYELGLNDERTLEEIGFLSEDLIKTFNEEKETMTNEKVRELVITLNMTPSEFFKKRVIGFENVIRRNYQKYHACFQTIAERTRSVKEMFVEYNIIRKMEEREKRLGF